MAHEKQFTAKQVAVTVLEKVSEMLKKSELSKPKEVNTDIITEFENISTLLKAEPKGEIHPKEHVEGEPEKPGARIEEQTPPQSNTHEQAEGNNEPAGTTPKDGIEQEGEMKGHLKLAKFIGRMEHKRVSKKVQSTAR